MSQKETVGCPTCDGTGCPCFRWRDWQSMDQGCHQGCGNCELNTCRPIPVPAATPDKETTG